jgi:hypothetical protein
MKDTCTNATIGTFTVASGGNGQDGADGCTPTVETSDKDANGCYTITTTPYSLVSGVCTAGTAVSKQVCTCSVTAETADTTVDGKPAVRTTMKDTCTDTTIGTFTVASGADGQNGVGVCDGVTDAATALKNISSVYTAGTSTTIGYMTNTSKTCNGTTTTTIEEDTCVQVVDSRTSNACSGAYLICKNQSTGATYNVCKAITGTNISSITSVLSTATAAAASAQSAADNAQSTANTALSTANANKDKIDNATTGLAAAHNAAANALSAAQGAQSTADTAAQNASDALDAAQRAQTTASGHTSQINTLNTTVGIGTAGANSVLGRLGSVETAVNGTCGGGASDSGGCTQGLQAQITSLQSDYSALQRSYNTLSQNYTALQTRVAAMETCSTCAAPKADN